MAETWLATLSKHKFLRKKRLLNELLLISPLFLAMVWFNAQFDAAEKVYAYLQSFESLDLDDLLFSISIFVPAYLVFFALRRKHEIESLVAEVGTDALTGILNRRRGMEVLKREVQRAQRYNRPLSLVIFDVDHFKLINDTYGHPVGDAVLRRFTAKVSGCVRKMDFLARIGGEEFMLICTETRGGAASDIAERLRFMVETENYGTESPVTASFGISQLRKGEGYAELLQRTDERLYWAKNEGRNRVVGPGHGKS